MSLIDSLERKFGKYAISNITYYLIGGQVIAFILIYSNPLYENYFLLQGNLLLKGELWRAITFLFAPLSSSIIFTAFTWYIFYTYGLSLEQHWGSFRYLIYLLIAYVGTIILSLLFPDATLSNWYIYTSLFLAFAFLYPNFTLLLFFIIPIKVKWLALLTWIGLLGGFILGSFTTKILTGVSISNFLLFFGKDLLILIQDKTQQTHRKTGKFLEQQKRYMKCNTCGATEQDNKIFYYCNICVPDTCYCEDHIHNHHHKKQSN